jgi:predicted RNA binding protein YcfA (HicA-like mRNA interferase family)
MPKYEKLIEKILSGRQDNNINFQDAVNLLKAFGFSERIRSSHHIFYRQDVEEIINIQPKDGHAKPYQIRQIRNLVVKYQLEVGSE